MLACFHGTCKNNINSPNLVAKSLTQNLKGNEAKPKKMESHLV